MLTQAEEALLAKCVGNGTGGDGTEYDYDEMCPKCIVLVHSTRTHSFKLLGYLRKLTAHAYTIEADSVVLCEFYKKYILSVEPICEELKEHNSLCFQFKNGPYCFAEAVITLGEVETTAKQQEIDICITSAPK